MTNLTGEYDQSKVNQVANECFSLSGCVDLSVSEHLRGFSHPKNKASSETRIKMTRTH